MKQFTVNYTIFKNYDERICEGDMVTKGTVTLEAEDKDQAMLYTWSMFKGWSDMKFKVFFRVKDN